MNECSIQGCVKTIKARGWCVMHYCRWQRHGDPLYQKDYKTLNKNLNCVVQGCERKRHVRKHCNTHYIKLKRSGTLEQVRYTPEWNKRKGEAQKTALGRLDSTPDPHPKRRGSYAVYQANAVKANARKRGIEFTLTPIETYNFFTADCFYCGRHSGWPNDRNGLDRVDNTKGYHPNNCVPCCSQCNSAKMTSTQQEFYEWVKRIHQVLSQKGLL